MLPDQLDDLDSRVQGRLLVAGDQGWNEAVAIWNGMAAKAPALVLQPRRPHVTWVREAWARIRPFSTGGNCINFQLAEDDTGRTAAAYGDNYQRLRTVKATYDPDNLFRVNRNIPQRGSESGG